MRVALFSETFLPRRDGVVTVLCRALEHLRARGVEAMLCAPRLGQHAGSYAGARVLDAPGLTFPPYPELRLALPTARMRVALREFRPHVTHFLHPSFFGLAAWLWARRAGLPTLVSWHFDYGLIARHFRLGPAHAGASAPLFNTLTRAIMERADACLAPSPLAIERLRAIGLRAEVGLWQRGVDAACFHPRHAAAGMRRRLAAGAPQDLLLLAVGRLSAEKGLLQLRAALDSLPRTQLALVGEGPQRAELERAFAGLPARFVGRLEGRALSQAYASADLLVFPSLVESCGLVVLEAMASGLPIVAARTGGVPQFLREGVTGYSFAPGDRAGMLAGLRRLAGNAGLRREMGRAARAFAETQSWSVAMDGLLAQYERIARRA